VTTVDRVPVSTPARTVFDLGRRKGLEEEVIRVDALANARPVTPGAESPRETRTRMLLLHAGFRSPQTQIVALDGTGHAFARVAMGWEEHRVGDLLRHRRRGGIHVRRDQVSRWTAASIRSSVAVRASRTCLLPRGP
jgi:hypothetical protein